MKAVTSVIAVLLFLSASSLAILPIKPNLPPEPMVVSSM